MRSRRVVLAGSSGFIGRALREHLNAQGHRVFGMDQRVSRDGEGFWSLDLTDVNRVSHVLELSAPDYIFHVAGLVNSDNASALYQAHVETTRALLEATKRAAPLARVVVLGSAAEYGLACNSGEPIREGTEPMPETAYGKSKLAQSRVADRLAVQMGLDVICVRLFNILGPGQGSHLVGGAMVDRLYKALAEGAQQLVVYDPSSERDYLDVRDVVRLLWIVATKVAQDSDRPPIHIASGKGTAVIDLASWLLQAARAESRLSLERVPGQTSTTLIGEPTTLVRLIGEGRIQRLSLAESLRDMWAWEIRRREGNR